jgi:putative membrane protein
MTAFVIRWAITAVAVMVTAWIFRGISYESTASLLGASLLLGIINAFVRPILLILSLPFIVVTMGLFIFVVNALLLLFVSAMIPSFHVAGFWDALLGSIIISIVSWLMSLFFRTSDGRVHLITHHGAARGGIKQAEARVVDE